MDLLGAALHIAQRIPDKDEYRLEREFCWKAVGKCALTLGDEEVFQESLAALPENRIGGELRLAAVGRSQASNSILADLLGRLAFWEEHLTRREMSDLTKLLASHFGTTDLLESVFHVEDAFTRTAMLVQLADGTDDPVIKLTLLSHARDQVSGVSAGNADYALKHLASGYIKGGWFTEAKGAIEQMEDISIRLDYLEYLERAVQEAGNAAEADALKSQREREADANPEERPQSEVLLVARTLANLDLDPNFPSSGTMYKRLEESLRKGDVDGALEQVRATFSTRFCPPTTSLPAPQFRDLLLFQLDRVASYFLNDLKVEFVTDLAAGLRRSGIEAPGEVLDFVATESFQRVAPASKPSIHAIDPCRLSFDDFVLALFDRPVATTEEEERIFRRQRTDDPGGSDLEAFIGLATQLFRGFGEIAPRYTPAQVDQAMWCLLGFPYNLWDEMQGSAVPQQFVIDCIRAGYRVFADYVSKQHLPESVTKFHMWWDESWRFEPGAVYDALVGTMGMVLDLPDEHSRYAALHGLNHLIGRDAPVPGAARVIDEFIASHGTEISAELLGYARHCRTGKAM